MWQHPTLSPSAIRLLQVQGATVVVTCMPLPGRGRASVGGGAAASGGDAPSARRGASALAVVRSRRSSASSAGSQRSIAGSAFDGEDDVVGTAPAALLVHIGQGVLRERQSADGGTGDAGPLVRRPACWRCC